MTKITVEYIPSNWEFVFHYNSFYRAIVMAVF
jgi:hypothetical protein